jgi:hypothetical protein
MMRLAKTALGLAVLGSLLLSGASAFGATTPTGGTINVFVTPTLNGSEGTIVITGAIGDYGKTVNANSAGKPAKKGSYELLDLKKGTILVNATQFNAATNNASPTFSAVTCSGSFLASAPAQIVSGTKAYAGITGSVTLTATYGFVGPFFKSGSKKGQCNTSNNAPTPPGFFVSITGSGTVSFG